MTYWARLKELRLYSLQRRRERYLIIYVFKILSSTVPNCGLSFQESERTGIRAMTKISSRHTRAPNYVKTIRSNSFPVVSSNLFNVLPAALRRGIDGKNKIDVFKKKLDRLLVQIPDQPTTPGLSRAAESNSLIHQFHYMTPE